MNAVRYWIAVVGVVGLVPAVAYWYVIHPFVLFWRRVGMRLTYGVMALVYLVLGGLAWHFRNRILGRDLGTNWWIIALGAVLYAVALLIERACRKHLTFRTLAGVPELEEGPGGQRLLREGIYDRVRHPRYLGLIFSTAAVACITNYEGMYLVFLAFVIAIVGVIRLEERELLERFGDAYRTYMSEVPRLVPRWR
jgi:protein-S-isoprenylcysteine O-methyltransferase Ste14